MRKKMFSFIAGIIMLPGFAITNAQDCRLFFPEKVGAMREMKFYDAKNKLGAISRQEILDKEVSGKDVKVKVKATNYNSDEEEVYTSELLLVCEDGIFKLDMQSLLDPATMAAYKDMKIEVTADNLVYPNNMKVGDNLPDGNMKVVVKSEQLTLITITLAVSNRKVDAIEDIKTEAGTFSCFKLSYDINSKFGFINKSGSVVEHISEGVGIVRSESFNKKGKTEGHSILTALK